MTSWKITGIVATIVIILSIPLYMVREKRISISVGDIQLPVKSTFVGSRKCRDCHKQEYDKWKGSHHERAMDVANEKTVLGDFNDAVFDHFGVVSRFYKKNGKYMVHTQGPGGKMQDFEITHTFGWYPLQQYLIPFPGGRLQCLPITWDVPKNQWYHLYPDQPLDPDDWLYWTNAGQNWNGMCAECHSTDLRKNYDLTTDTYQTTWSEISVGCEACHGPGSAHVKWAELPEMGRPEIDNAALSVKTRNMTARQQIDLCAPCHSRRTSLDDNIHRHADFLDYGIPQLLSEGMYFADGQILDEVYVYGSFMQSKMYARDVRCSDCHDVHSIKRIHKGNELCLQCHKAAVYHTKNHHFHKAKGEKGDPIKSKSGEIVFDVGTGAECEQCHMPGRDYMGIDYRPDHSFRIPRPDLSTAIDSPNACNRCHFDKTTQWSVDALTKWYGKHKRSHYGTSLFAGRQRDSEAMMDLVQLAGDRLYPAIVRATALALLAQYDTAEKQVAFEQALSDEEALLRYTAVRHLNEQDPRKRLKQAGALVYDPVRAVRIEAARSLVTVPPDLMNADLRRQFQETLGEYRHAMERTADFAASRHNLGNLYIELNQSEQAIHQYQAAIKIDQQFYPAKVNLATLLNQLGDNAQAEKLLREVVTAEPELYDVKYSLGLLLAEMKQYQEAAIYIGDAVRGLPQRSRIHYNLGLLQQFLKRDWEAERSLVTALELEPENRDYLYALADFYIKKQRLKEARPLAAKMVTAYPGDPMGRRMLDFIEKQLADSP